ncbi:MAG: hypothetical protein AB8F74_02850 [Saprospiraceae bacterium]
MPNKKYIILLTVPLILAGGLLVDYLHSRDVHIPFTYFIGAFSIIQIITGLLYLFLWEVAEGKKQVITYVGIATVYTALFPLAVVTFAILNLDGRFMRNFLQLGLYAYGFIQSLALILLIWLLMKKE